MVNGRLWTAARRPFLSPKIFRPLALPYPNILKEIKYLEIKDTAMQLLTRKQAMETAILICLGKPRVEKIPTARCGKCKSKMLFRCPLETPKGNPDLTFLEDDHSLGN